MGWSIYGNWEVGYGSLAGEKVRVRPGEAGVQRTRGQAGAGTALRVLRLLPDTVPNPPSF